ncbi:MAG: hypothetical protein H8D23_34095 [Candidatus Brocadiales bacterium]|nr:hypothetical protein [Candidatus Brocadiales bacterium]
MRNPLEHAQRYTESREMFLYPLDKRSIIRYMKPLDAVNTLATLAKIVWVLEDNNSPISEIQGYIASEILDPVWLLKALTLIHKGGTLYFRPQIHIAMKYAARYAVNNSPPAPMENELLSNLGYSLFAVTDLIAQQSVELEQTIKEEDPFKRISIRLFTGEYFISPRNPLLDIARSKQMFGYYHRKFSPVDTIDYLDIDQYFSEACGLTIQKYLTIGFGFLVKLLQFRKTGSIIPDDPNFIIFHPSEYFAGTKIAKEDVDKMFNFLSMSIEEVGSLIDSQSLREISYNFLNFQSRPFIEINLGRVIPVSFYFVIERFTTGVYWIILDYLSQTGQSTQKQKFMQYHGFLFEQYIADMAEEIFNRISDHGKQFYADEIYLRDGTEVKTSDAILVTSDSIILIEATAARISAKKTIVDGREEAFNDDCEKTIFKKAGELDRCITDLRNGIVTIDGMTIDGNKRIYPLIVAIEGFPQFPVINTFIERELEDRELLTQDNIAPLGILSADEFSTIARFKPLDILKVIKQWQSSKYFPGITLEDFIYNTTNFSRSDESEWWKEGIEKIWDEAAEEIFGKKFKDLEHSDNEQSDK